MEVGFHVPGPAAGDRQRGSVFASAGSDGVRHASPPRDQAVKRALRRGVLACTIATVCAAVVVVGAQVAPPSAELTPLNGADGVHAGDTAHLALQVKLPDGLHTNSNKPHDPSLIRITLTVDPAAGVTPDEIVFPDATDLKVDKTLSENPLSVFTGTFVVGVALKVAPTATLGDASVVAKLHYQACDEKQC